MKTPTILILFIIAMQLITSANALIFDGMLGDIVFWVNSALFMGAMAVYVYRMDKEKNTAKK